MTHFKNTQVFHTIYLPANYDPKSPRKYPVIFEFPGNGPYVSPSGDRCSGKIEDCCMGYGISGGKDFIWVVLPFVSTDGQHHQRQWWGDPDQTTKYCLEVAESLPKLFHADPDRYVLCGFSRGAIACNYIGLRNDRIAKLWKAMICHSHYDGVLKWNYPDSDFRSALNRLRRLKTIPQFICQEKTTKPTQTYLEKTKIAGSFTFLDLPFANHTDRWLLKDLPERKRLRQWLTRVLKD